MKVDLWFELSLQLNLNINKRTANSRQQYPVSLSKPILFHFVYF